MILIDSNIWIFAARKNQPENAMAIARVADTLGGGEACVNGLIISEVFHNISLLHGKSEAQKKTAAILMHPMIEWIPFTRTQALDAATLSVSSGIRINDAMIAAQALDIGAKVLTDNVKDFRRVPGLKIIPLREKK